MSFTLRDYQKRLLGEIESDFQSGEREVCLAASCGAGKTAMSIHHIADYLRADPSHRAIVMAEGQMLLRSQFARKAQDLNLFDFDLVKSGSDLLCAQKRVVITLPQTIHQLSSVPRFGLAVVDEAHHFYHQPMVQTILNKARPERTLLLTGTPSNFVANKTKIRHITMSELFTLGYVPDIYFELVSTSEPITDKCFNPQQNVSQAYRFQRTEQALAKVLPLLDMRLRSYRNGAIHDWTPNFFKQWRKESGAWELPKSIVACNNRGQAKIVLQWFKNCGIGAVLSVSGAESWADPESAGVDSFRDDPKVRVLIVVARGILGFDFPPLVNFVDMTFTRDLNRIHQGYARLAREHPDGAKKMFIKVVPSASAPYYRWVMEAALLLTHPDWLLQYNGKNFRDLPLPVIPKPRTSGGTGGGTGGTGGTTGGGRKQQALDDAPDFGVDCPVFGKIMKQLGLLLDSPFCPYRRTTLAKTKAALDGATPPWDDEDDKWLRRLAEYHAVKNPTGWKTPADFDIVEKEYLAAQGRSA